MKLIDLTLTPAEIKEQNGDSAPSIAGSGSDEDGPKYPWGTSLFLSDLVVKKMGLELPAVGSKMLVTAEVTVTSISKRENQKGVDQTVDLQMTALALEPKAAPAADRSVGREARMFPSMLGS